MDKTPAYIIGVGNIGVKVVSNLQSRFSGDKTGDSVGLMAIDADNERLSTLSGLPTLHLKSDSGLLENRADAYPFLSSDMYVPNEGSDCRRHVGRYKLDNAVSPTFSSHRQSISNHIKGFINRTENSLEEIPGTFNITLVSSMADGTGSGTFPLLLALLQNIKNNLSSSERQIQVCYLGFFPTLVDIDNINHPCAYVNAHAALQDLNILLDVAADNPLSLPVYSSQSFDQGDKPGENNNHLISMEESPLDACWLVEREPEVGDSGDLQADCDMISQICDGLYALTTQTPNDYGPLDYGSTTSPLGTFGYARIAIPHERVGRYCELRAKRDEVKEELEEYIRPKLESLRLRRKELESRIDTEPREMPLLDDWIKRVFSWLQSEPDTSQEFVCETEKKELEAVLNQFSTLDTESYLQATQALRYELSDQGETGSTVCADIRQVIAMVRDTHDYELLEKSGRTLSATGEERQTLEPLEQVTEELIQRLEQQKDSYQEQRAKTGLRPRDFLPPTHAAFTSHRERLQKSIDQIEESLDSLKTAANKLNSLKEFRALTQEHEKIARERIQNELDGIENDIEHYRVELHNLRERHRSLNENINSERLSLAQSTKDGPIYHLPLRYDKLQNISQKEYSECLTSIESYRERGLIDSGEEQIHRLLRECYRESRDWSPSISRHNLSVSRDSLEELTFVLYDKDNQPLVLDLASEFTESGTIWSSSDQATSCIEDPFRMEIISLSYGGKPQSLEGFNTLDKWRQNGYLQDLATTKYKNSDRARAYPEWYDKPEDKKSETGS